MLGGGEQANTRILGAIAFVCSNRVGPGQIHHIDHGWLRMGELSGPAQPRTHSIAELFRTAGIQCEVYDSLRRARWEKMVWNVPFNGLGVAARANVAQVLSDPELRQLARNLMEDILVAARADGLQLNESLCEVMMRNSETMGPYRTSMQIDFEEARPLEFEAIIGEPLRRARTAGLQTPYLKMLYTIVRRMASSMSTPSR
jgi:2-dehydropantoate 2-reductase